MRIRSASFGTAALVILATSTPSTALCTRLPLSDIGFSRPEAIAAARQKLNAYAIEELAERGWSGRGPVRPSNERVACKPYVSVGSLAAGYRCLVTTTFCVHRPQRLTRQKLTPQKQTSAIGRVVRLRLKGSSFEISGTLKKFDKASYVIAPPNSGNVTVPAHRFDCISDICPKVN